MIAVTLPLKIVSESNQRCHWREKSARARQHRSTARLMMAVEAGPAPIAPGIVITLTRIAPRELDDDNLASGFKATRDGVADWLGIDDGSKRLKWLYAQRKGRPGQYAALVTVDEVE